MHQKYLVDAQKWLKSVRRDRGKEVLPVAEYCSRMFNKSSKQYRYTIC